MISMEIIIITAFTTTAPVYMGRYFADCVVLFCSYGAEINQRAIDLHWSVLYGSQIFLLFILQQTVFDWN